MSPLGSSPVMAFIGTRSAETAKAFYGGLLGMTLLNESPFALEFDGLGCVLRVTMVREVSVAPYTVLGWRVEDIVVVVDGMAERGVVFERFGGLPQDERGIWTAPGGDQVAWFKDPEGQILSISCHLNSLR